MSQIHTEKESCQVPVVCPTAAAPCVPLAFRVGIVGHRPNRLKQANLTSLASALHTVLAMIRDSVIEFSNRKPRVYDSCSPVLRAITPLAEGTDRLFAHQAISL